MPDEPPPLPLTRRSSLLARDSLRALDAADPRPVRGGVILGALLAGCLFLEACRRLLLVFVIQQAIAPRVGLMIGSGLVVCAYAGLALAVLANVRGARWIAGILSGALGAWLLLWSLILAAPYVPTQSSVSRSFDPVHLINEGLGAFLIAQGLCLLLSRDAIAFIEQKGAHRHRRVFEWAAVGFGVYFALIVTMPMMAAAWLQSQSAQAEGFAEETLRALSVKWDPAIYEARLDPAANEYSTPESRASTLRSFAEYGPTHDIHLVESSLNPVIDLPNASFRLEGSSYFAMKFERTEGTFHLLVHRRLFGPWQIDSYSF